MVQGDLRLADPGQDLDVDVIADPDGTVADRGDPVEIAGEANGRTQVQLVTTPGDGIGSLKSAPAVDDGDYAAGEVAGKGTALAQGPVDWYEDASGGAVSPGDLVVLTGTGVRAYDSAGGDTPDMILGRVFATGTRASAETANKVAVLRHH
ncbi:hypothetical protein [Halobacterium salinarum]|uniref:hypothetical protein n=1 Tax=Halobacterium salinarum TaxID=2242 RepID=UPI0025569C53|nr:hypothetical protein [Halobacterium salinarum]MDL0127076.1 hypothetical protein [Halobacterium salinarum]